MKLRFLVLLLILSSLASTGTLAGIPITGGMSGSWFNPSQSGHGFALEVVDIPGQAGPVLAAFWFTYLDGEQVWLVGQGPIDGDSAVLATQIFTGAGFPPGFDPATVIAGNWGTLTFIFSDCNNGTVTWNSGLPGFGSGSLSIVRLTKLAGIDCVAAGSTVQVQHPSSSPQPLNPRATFGAGTPGIRCSTAQGSNCAVTIPDNTPAGVTSQFLVNGCTSIADVNLGLDLSHIWIGDLLATVTSPAGTSLTVIDRPGVPQASAFGCGEDNIQVVLDDEAPAPAEDRCAASPPPPAAIDGSFSPLKPLSTFDGESGNGTWQLNVTDVNAGDTGNLNNWSLEFTCASAIPQGYSGAWFNPDQSGHGFVLEVVKIPGKSDPILVAYWFTFINGKQAWLIGQGPIKGNSAVLATQIFSGANFPPNFDPADAVGTGWGTLTFTFSGCNNSQVSWESNLPGFGSGNLELVRLTTLTNLSCGLVFEGQTQ